jgi:hypothetical protein
MACLQSNKCASTCFSTCLESSNGTFAAFGSNSSCPDPAGTGNTACPDPRPFASQLKEQQMTFAVGAAGRYLLPEKLWDSAVLVTAVDGAAGALATGDKRSPNLIVTHNSNGIVVFDLTNITLAAYKATGAAALRASTTVETTPTDVVALAANVLVPRFTVTNKGCHPAYVLTANEKSGHCFSKIEGVHRSVGVRPRESVEFFYDPRLDRWCIDRRSSSL